MCTRCFIRLIFWSILAMVSGHGAAYAATSLTEASLTGAVDASILRELIEANPELRSLDLSEAEMSELPPYSLAATSLESLTLPDGLRTIGESALAGTRLRTLHIPASVTAIGSFALSGCSELTAITGAQSLRVIGEGAMRRCPRLEEVPFATTLDSIAPSALRGSAIVTADLSRCARLRTIGAWALAGCTALESVSLPADLDSIGQGAFFGDNSLATLVVGGSPERIGDFAFAHSAALASVDGTGMTSVPELGMDVWHGIDCPGVTLTVLARMLADFAATPGWQEFHIVAPSGIDTTASYKDQARFSAVFIGSDLRIDATMPIATVAVYDMAGRLRMAVDAPNLPATISAASLPAGVYIVGATFADGTFAAVKAPLK